MKPNRRDSRLRTLMAVVAVAVAGVFLSNLGASSHPQRRVRIVLITLDTLRYDSFSGTPDSSTTMSHLRTWAEGATVFDQFFTATATTRPSHASMFTALHPWDHGVLGNEMVLREGHETVAEQLQKDGFTTSAVVASVPMSRRSGFAQGFERYDDEFVTGQLLNGHGLRASTPQVQEDAWYSLAVTITDRALAELDDAGGMRQFFWFHYFDPHSPYGDSAGGVTMQTNKLRALNLTGSAEAIEGALARARRLYDQDVAVLDRELGRLLSRLDRDLPSTDVHIVIAGDHGESFGEQGAIGHGRRLIKSQLHTPCVIRSPRLSAGEDHNVAGSVDIGATLLAMAGSESALSLNPGSFGRDLTRPGEVPPRAYGMRRTWQKPPRGVRLDGTIGPLDEHLFFMVSEKGILYRGNGSDVLAEPPATLTAEEAKRIRDLFAGFEDQLQRTPTRRDEDPQLERGLKSLGYVQ